MHAEPKVPTLLDDWQARRDHLLSETGAVWQHSRALVRVLEYLIDRYQDAHEAARPARGPLATSVYLNERAIVVHHHLWEGKVGGAKTQIQAHDRMASIVRRMTSHAREEVTEGAPRGDEEPAPSLEPVYLPTDPLDPGWRMVGFDLIRRLMIRLGWKPHRYVKRRLASFGWLVSREVMDYLYGRLVDPAIEDTDAVYLLALCHNASASAVASLARRERLERFGRDRVTDRLEDLFFLPPWAHARPSSRPEDFDRIRGELAADRPVVRLGAIRILGHLGELDDVALLSDLLALPPQEDEHPDERPAMLRAIEQISGAGSP